MITNKGRESCGRVLGRSNNNANANAGVAYSNTNNASSNSNTNNGGRLCLFSTLLRTIHSEVEVQSFLRHVATC
jgi:hypothetical protein